MQVVVVGVNHNSAPVEVRERLAFPPASLGEALAALRAEVEEGLILSTCNRVELYAVAGHADSGTTRLARFLSEARGVPLDELRPQLYTYAHAEAVEHLLAVASGLDSMVLGEDQILGQVRGALEAAQEAGTLGPALHRLGSVALAVGKRVRNETGLSRSPVSVVSVALQAAAQSLGDLRTRRVAVVGAGRTAALALEHLAELPPGAITLVNRTFERADALARAAGQRAVPWEALESALAGADLVVSCTSAPCVVVGPAQVARGRAAHGSAQVYLDLAVPRDVHPAAAEVPGVVLYDVDRLQGIASENRGRRQREVGAAEAIVRDGVAAYMEWWESRRVAPAIARLRDHAEAIRDAEVARVLARLPDLTPRQAALVRDMAARLVNKLLHRPVTALKQDAEGANLALAVDRLFGIGTGGQGEDHEREQRTA